MIRSLQEADRIRAASLIKEVGRRQAKDDQSKRGWYDKDGVRQGGLIAFVRYFWKVLEPETPFTDGWVLHAICEHLEAVTFGDINRLLINVSPGSMKSLLTSVFWPAWEWGAMNKAHLRYVAFSYSATLTERDNNRFTSLITSPEYQALYGDRVQVVKTGEKRVSNTKKGWKLASSIGGVGTGERGDRIICVSGKTVLETECGKQSISQIVASKIPRFVLGYDIANNCPRWQRICAYETNEPRPFVRVRFVGGELLCTEDHPVYVIGRGYAEAQSLREGEKALYLESLRDVRGTVSPTLQDVQSEMCGRARNETIKGAQQSRLFCVRGIDLSDASSLEAGEWCSILQPYMPRDSKSRGRKPSLVWRVGREVVQALRSVFHFKEERGGSAHSLFAGMCNIGQMGKWVAGAKAITSNVMRNLRKVGPPTSQNKVLFEGMFGSGPRGSYARFWQRAVCPWPTPTAIWSRLDAEEKEGSEDAGRVLLPPLFPDREGSWGGSPCPPYQLRQERHGNGESDYPLSGVSRRNAWGADFQGRMDEKTVIAVERIEPEPTFNVRVEPNHNYFANGILTHNCDDPNNVKEAESETVRSTTIQWFRESMSNRLNDMRSGAIIVIMQRVHADDISGCILSLGLDYAHLCIPMEYDWARQTDKDGEAIRTPIGWTDPRYVPNEPDECDGTLAWPERFPPETVQETKHAVGPYGWAGQYQQQPAPRGGGIFKRSWWQLWEHPEGKFPVFEYLLASLDSAYTQKEENDPSAMTVWGIFRNEHDQRRIMLVHAWRKHLQFSADRSKIERTSKESVNAWRRRSREHWGLMEWVVDTCERFKVDKLLIEAKASGISAAQELANRFGLQKWSVQLCPVSGDKYARAIACQPTFSQLMVYAPERDWSELVIEEMEVFPKHKYDDLCDSASQAIKHLRDMGLAQTDEEAHVAEIENVRQRSKVKAIYPI